MVAVLQHTTKHLGVWYHMSDQISNTPQHEEAYKARSIKCDAVHIFPKYQALDLLFTAGHLDIDAYQRCRRSYAALVGEYTAIAANEALLAEAATHRPTPNIIHTLKVDLELLRGQMAVRQERAHTLHAAANELHHARRRLLERRNTLLEAARLAAQSEHQVRSGSIL